jgi:single-strand DNA-binding protein
VNTVVVRGNLSSEPRRRTLPSGSVLVTWEVTTDFDGSRLSVPVVWVDPPAAPARNAEGDEVVVLGHVRRRYFVGANGTASSTEVVGERACKPGSSKQVSALVARAQQRIAEVSVV